MNQQDFPTDDDLPTESLQQRSKTGASQTFSRLHLLSLWMVAVLTTSAAIFVVMNDIHFTRVLSGSMAPQFHVGDTLMVKPIPKRDLEIGQVAILPSQNDEGQFAHRIISVKTSGVDVFVKTKGDANPVSDPWTLRILSQRVPVVVAIVPTKNLPIVNVNRNVSIAFLIGIFAIGAGLSRVRQSP